MSDRIIDTIRLSGKDSIKFVNNLFRPSYEYIQKNNRIMEYIENNIEIKNLDNGFEASIADLDLSFLDKINYEKKIKIEFTMKVNMESTIYYNDEKQSTDVKWVGNDNNILYGKPEDSGFLSCAA